MNYVIKNVLGKDGKGAWRLTIISSGGVQSCGSRSVLEVLNLLPAEFQFLKTIYSELDNLAAKRLFIKIYFDAEDEGVF